MVFKVLKNRNNKHLNDFEEEQRKQRKIYWTDSTVLAQRKISKDYDSRHYIKIMEWMNTLSRKILDYRTPLEAFAEELNKLEWIDELDKLVQFDIAI